MARFWVLGTGTWDGINLVNWATSTGGAGGNTPPTGVDSATFDGSSGGGTATVNTNFSIANLIMGAFTGALDFSANNNSPTMVIFNGSGTGTRTLNMGSGTWSITGNNATVWTFATTTGLTLNKGTSTINFTYSGSVGTRTIASGGTTINNFQVSAGSDTVSFDTMVCTNFDMRGFSGTVAPSALTIAGSFWAGSGSSWNTSGSAWNFTATSSQTITFNGVQINKSPTFNGVGGTWTLQDDMNIDGASARTLTLTNGTINANNKIVTTGIFSSSNANTRVVTMGSNTWTLTGNAATIWDTSTVTGLTLSGSGTIICNYSGSTGTRTLAMGGVAVNNISITAGSDIVVIQNGNVVNLDYTGFTGASGQSASTISVSGNFTLGTGMTYQTGSGVTSLTSSSTCAITFNGVNMGRPLTINGTGVFTLQDDLNVSLDGSRILTVTQGTFNANNKNVTTSRFNSNNSNTRTITKGSGTWNLTSTGTIWDSSTTTGLTFADSGTTKITNTSNTDNTFAGGGLTFNNIWFSRGSSTATNTITGANTFNDFKDDGSAAHTIVFPNAVTKVSTFTVSGTAGNLITLSRTGGSGSWEILKTGGGTVNVDYVVISNSNAVPENTFFAGAHSVDGGGNSGWIFNTTQQDQFFALM